MRHETTTSLSRVGHLRKLKSCCGFEKQKVPGSPRPGNPFLLFQGRCLPQEKNHPTQLNPAEQIHINPLGSCFYCARTLLFRWRIRSNRFFSFSDNVPSVVREALRNRVLTLLARNLQQVARVPHDVHRVLFHITSFGNHRISVVLQVVQDSWDNQRQQEQQMRPLIRRSHLRQFPLWAQKTPSGMSRI
jgi:hypothetical protein